MSERTLWMEYYTPGGRRLRLIDHDSDTDTVTYEEDLRIASQHSPVTRLETLDERKSMTVAAWVEMTGGYVN